MKELENSTVGNTVLREVSSQRNCESHATMPGHGIGRVVWAAQSILGVPIFLSPPSLGTVTVVIIAL